MRAVVCRVSHAAVSVDQHQLGAIDRGLLVYVGILQGDTEKEVDWLARKLPALRIFPDDHDRMNRSPADLNAALLLIPNFTLAARPRKGTRPSFTDAADPTLAQPLFQQLVDQCARSVTTAAGRFGAHMHITAAFDGPVTIILDSPASRP